MRRFVQISAHVAHKCITSVIIVHHTSHSVWSAPVMVELKCDEWWQPPWIVRHWNDEREGNRIKEMTQNHCAKCCLGLWTSNGFGCLCVDIFVGKLMNFPERSTFQVQNSRVVAKQLRVRCDCRFGVDTTIMNWDLIYFFSCRSQMTTHTRTQSTQRSH